MSTYREKDAVLWDAYWAADSDGGRADAIEALLAAYLPWITAYARNTARRSWNADQREEYVQELLVVVMQRIPQYERGAVPFTGFIAPYLQPVRYRVHGRLLPIGCGIETARLMTAAGAMEAGGASVGEIAAELSAGHGKPISEKRVESLLSRSHTVSGDAPHADGEGSGWETMRHSEDTDFSESVVSVVAVREALAAVKFSPMERAILAERLMASPADRALTATIAARFSVSPQAVSKAEAKLADRLRRHLGGLAA